MEPNSPSPRFRALASRLRAGEPVGLAEAALVLAGEFRPELDPDAPLAELDRLASDAARVVPNDGERGPNVARLVTYLREDAGFRGNELQYDDPRNSDLDVVLTERTGIPITLAIVYAEVAARLGLTLQGVSFPGHFLLRTPEEPPVVIDAFHG
ncbi:MAG: transglutaminase-like domain-containing protein, partial [Myxococcota bacterium]